MFQTQPDSASASVKTWRDKVFRIILGTKADFNDNIHDKFLYISEKKQADSEINEH